MIAGVCGGLGQYFNIDPTIIRIIFVLLIFANGIGILAYIIMAIVVPLEESKAAKPEEVIRENVEELKRSAEEVGRDIQSAFSSGEVKKREVGEPQHQPRYIVGIILVVIGILFLLGSFNLLWWLRWSYLWPVIIIAIGLVIVFGIRRKR